MYRYVNKMNKECIKTHIYIYTYIYIHIYATYIDNNIHIGGWGEVRQENRIRFVCACVRKCVCPCCGSSNHHVQSWARVRALPPCRCKTTPLFGVGLLVDANRCYSIVNCFSLLLVASRCVPLRSSCFPCAF